MSGPSEPLNSITGNKIFVDAKKYIYITRTNG